MIYHAVKNRDGKALFIFMFYISSLLPWMFISRVAFIYHYFPCTIFLTMALCYVFNDIWDRKHGRYKFAVFAVTGGALLLFVMFYPVISGYTVSPNYTKYFLRWVPSQWPF
jgi:dolichyl-phosphate-mannose--protein O-mannosyl transferase